MDRNKQVWIPNKSNFYEEATLHSTNNNLITVQLSCGQLKEFKKEQVEHKNPSKFDYVNDLSHLSYLNEPSVIYNLCLRYYRQQIYTHSGIFLLAMNPFRKLSLYGKMEMEKYSKNFKNKEPHIYKTAADAYNLLLSNNENQSILITGESGAGKTENMKRVIEYFSFISTNKNSTLENLILESTKFLEYIGNAKTARNNNSSRFGKFIKVYFEDGNITGSTVSKYLLEKSRITHLNENEQNYHIFHFLFTSKYFSEKLRKFKSRFIFSVYSEEKCNAEMDYVFKMFDLFAIDRNAILNLLSAIILIGSINFSEENGQAILKGENLEIIDQIAILLSIQSSQLLKKILYPERLIKQELVNYTRSKEQAIRTIEALARHIYEVIFDYIINKINIKLAPKNGKNFIGILDIAGFEIFENNSFEQLCINYTNEKLQQFFNHHMFILEQEIYAKEKIEWDFIDFGLDLQPTIDSIEKNIPPGIFALINEESIMPKGKWENFLLKMRQSEKLFLNLHKKIFQVGKFGDSFSLIHYAGNVEYKVNGWLEKNKDTAFSFFDSLFTESKNKQISEIFKGSNLIKTTDKKGYFKTVAHNHKTQLNVLMEDLRKTNPHFVRCLLPNEKWLHTEIDNFLMLKQLRCNGVLEGIRISRLGYPNRMEYDEFRRRYSFLDTTCTVKAYEYCTTDIAKQITKNICSELSNAAYRLGISRVFFKAEILASFENKREIFLSEIKNRMKILVMHKINLLKEKKQEREDAAIKIIKKNALHYLTLKKDMWWKLYLKVKPLLDITRKEQEMVELNNTIKTLRKQLNEKQSLIEKSYEESKKMQNDLKNKNDDLKELENKLNECTDEILFLKEEKNRLGNKLCENEILFSNLNKKLNDALIFHKKCTEFENLLAEKAMEIKNLENAENNLRIKIQNSEKSLEIERGKNQTELTKLLHEKDSQIKNIEMEKQTLENTIKKLIEEMKILNRKLNEQVEELAGKDKIIFENNSEFEKLKSDLTGEQFNSTALQNQITQDIAEMTMQRKEIEDLNTSLLNAEQKNFNLRTQLSEKNSVILKLENDLKIEKNQLQYKIEEFQNIILKKENEIEHVKSDFLKKNENIRQNEQLINRNKKLASEIHALQERIDELEDTQNNLEKYWIEKFQGEIDSREKANNILRQQSYDLNTKLKRFSEENSILRSQVERSNDSSTDELAILLGKERSKNTNLRKKITELENNLLVKNTQRIEQEKISVLEGEIHSMGEEINKFYAEIAKLISDDYAHEKLNRERIVDELSKTKDALLDFRKYNLKLKRELALEKRKMESINADNKNRVTFTNELFDLKKQIGEHRLFDEELFLENEEMKEQVNELQKSSEQTKLQTKELLKKINILKLENEKMRREKISEEIAEQIGSIAQKTNLNDEKSENEIILQLKQENEILRDDVDALKLLLRNSGNKKIEGYLRSKIEFKYLF